MGHLTSVHDIRTIDIQSTINISLVPSVAHIRDGKNNIFL
jgi:hypothetical protein